MKKMIYLMIALVVFLMTGMAEASSILEHTVIPLNPIFIHAKVNDRVYSGEYAVEFSVRDLHKTIPGYSVKMRFYNYDKYDVDEIIKLVPGQKIMFCKKNKLVKEVEFQRDVNDDQKIIGVAINGGIEQGGFDLTYDAKGHYFRSVGMNDHPIYYPVGMKTIPISRDFVFKDCIDIDPLAEGHVLGAESLPECITEHTQEFYFNELQTKATISDGELVYLERKWIP